MELARIAGLAGAHELQMGLSSLRMESSGEHYPMPQGSTSVNVEVYEIIGGFLDTEDAQASWFYCLKEACYAMAADYDLQRYFLSDYHRIRFDYGAYYELWIGGDKRFFDDGQCIVSTVKRR
jgi:hypothetical protein